MSEKQPTNITLKHYRERIQASYLKLATQVEGSNAHKKTQRIIAWLESRIQKLEVENNE